MRHKNITSGKRSDAHGTGCFQSGCCHGNGDTQLMSNCRKETALNQYSSSEAPLVCFFSFVCVCVSFHGCVRCARRRTERVEVMSSPTGECNSAQDGEVALHHALHTLTRYIDVFELYALMQCSEKTYSTTSWVLLLVCLKK